MNKPVGVTKEIIQGFLSEVEEKGISKDIVKRLRKSLVDDARCSEKALFKAIFPEDGS